jgi:hypothetical protein
MQCILFFALVMSRLCGGKHVHAFQGSASTSPVSPSRALNKNEYTYATRQHERTRLLSLEAAKVEEMMGTASATSHESDDIEEITLVPLSRDPILLISSRPLLNPNECTILQKWFQDKQSKQGQTLMSRVWKHVDDLVGCEAHMGESLPRILTYEPSSQESLLPDGLHVDTNNGRYFRHVTCLLYLTTNKEGATTFPLANRMDTMDCCNATVLNAAQSLLDSGVTHTFDKSGSEEHQKCCRSLEMAAEMLYKQDKGDGEASSFGLRVLPRAGMLCVFCNLLEDGTADPHSFHGGESGNAKEKALLTFFKEIPVETFSSQAELGQRAAETRRFLVEHYYDSKEVH